MAVKRFMIAPLEAGLATETKAWLQADDAYERLENAYNYYGRMRKRFGATVMNLGAVPAFAQLYSRLGMQIGNTDGAGNLIGGPVIVPGVVGDWFIGQIFGVGNLTAPIAHEIFTVVIANGAMLASDTGNGTFNTATGAVNILASKPNKPVYWYPALPVMGLPQYQIGAVGEWPTFAFDTRFAYVYTNLGNGDRWEINTALPPAVNSYYTAAPAADFNFVWALNYRGHSEDITILFTTNNVNQMRYFTQGAGWNVIPYLPQYAADPLQTIQTCLAIAYFKGRLLLFNVLQNQIVGPALRFPQRVRWSAAAFDPLDLANAFNVNAHRGGGFEDAPTKEQIISVAHLKDRLIVYFEETTMELVFTGNAADPFRWQTINNELGVESTFSPVLFDKAVIGVGNVGVHACNGTNVERVDEDIRQNVFEIENGDNGPKRVYGIRDYANELLYWTYPNAEDAAGWPTKVLVYNYRKGNWALNDDSITCFGYFENVANMAWVNYHVQWQEAQRAWNDGAWQDEYTAIVAGNQEGFTFLLDVEVSKNSAALSITNMDFAAANAPILQVIDHNMLAGDFIFIESVAGVNVADFNNQIFMIVAIVDADHFSLARTDTAGQAYQGGGVITRVSRVDIITKQFNFFQQDGRNAYISKVDFNVDRTANGEITVDFFTSTSNVSLLTDGQLTGSILGTSVLETRPYGIYPYEATQKQLWHPVYFQADGEYVQFRIYLSDQQMFTNNIAFSDFELNAFTVYAEPTATRLQ